MRLDSYPSEASAFVPGPIKRTHHIVWNLLLTSKDVPLSPTLIEDEQIGHILAILPWKAEYLELNKEVDVPYSVLEYYDIHEPVIDKEAFEKACTIINELAIKGGKKRNVLVFCNNGYQRSLPFLVYYLTKFHKDEFPSIDTAVDLILSQLDRTNFMTLRDETTKKVRLLLD